MNDRDGHRSTTPGRRRRALVVVAAVAVSGALIAGCGSDDDDTAAPDETAVASGTEGTTEDTAADAGGGSGEAASIDIVSVSEAFAPAATTVAVGEEVTWVNTDGVAHTTTADDGAWDSGSLASSEEFTFVADEPGTYAYFCAIHPSMTGELVVE